jgi:hypothetical protein
MVINAECITGVASSIIELIVDAMTPRFKMQRSSSMKMEEDRSVCNVYASAITLSAQNTPVVGLEK